jgi:hypothetical protein
MPAAHDLLRPFALLAAVAFAAGFLGFLGYLALGDAPLKARIDMQPAMTPAGVSGVASDDWNIPKHI